MQVLVPWWSAWEGGLNGDTDEVHDSERACKYRNGAWRSKNKHDQGADSWTSKMENAVWEPCQDIKDDILVLRQDVGEIGAIEDVLKRWENLDPDMRAHFFWDKTGQS